MRVTRERRGIVDVEGRSQGGRECRLPTTVMTSIAGVGATCLLGTCGFHVASSGCGGLRLRVAQGGDTAFRALTNSEAVPNADPAALLPLLPLLLLAASLSALPSSSLHDLCPLFLATTLTTTRFR